MTWVFSMSDECVCKSGRSPISGIKIRSGSAGMAPSCLPMNPTDIVPRSKMLDRSALEAYGADQCLSVYWENRMICGSIRVSLTQLMRGKAHQQMRLSYKAPNQQIWYYRNRLGEVSNLPKGNGFTASRAANKSVPQRRGQTNKRLRSSDLFRTARLQASRGMRRARICSTFLDQAISWSSSSGFIVGGRAGSELLGPS